MGTNDLTSLDDVSDEIVVRILHFCNYTSILQFAATCHRYFNVVKHTTSLQLHIRLESSGLEIVGRSAKRNTSYASILNELRQYQEAWLDLDIATPLDLSEDDQTPEMLLWELREGFYFRAVSSRNSQTRPDSLQTLDLGSMIISRPVLFKFDFQEFTVDPEQQLAVLVRVDTGAQRSHFAEVHLRSTITGLQHPLAQHPIFTVELDFPVSWRRPFSIVLEILGSKLIIKFADTYSRAFDILIWNWISGHFLYRIDSRSGISDFNLLDERYLVLYSASPLQDSEFLLLQRFSLMVYDISTTSGASPYTHFRAASYPTHSPCVIFELPRIHSDMSIAPTNFLSRSDPIPGRTLHTSSVTFASSRALTIGLSVSLYIPERTPRGLDEGVYLRIFVSVPELLKHLAERRESVPVTLPWNIWGEKATRWFIDDDEPTVWICWMSGSRYISSTDAPDYGVEELSQLSVVDFNSSTVKRHSTRSSDRYSNPSPRADETAHDGMELVVPRRPLNPIVHEHPNNVIVQTVGSDAPTIIRTGFEEDVVSRLPYRIVTRVEPVPRHSGWLIAGDHVIGVNPIARTSTELSVFKLRLPAES